MIVIDRGSSMGFHLNAVFSSEVEYSKKHEILNAAKTNWFFVRIPRGTGQFITHAHFSPPELTASKFKSEDGFVQALEKNCRVEDELVDWSKKFPGVKFAFVEADGRGRTNLYSGFICKDGMKIKVQDPERLGHMKLLSEVGIRVEKYFPPFESGYFDAES
jgi:hypothetical protein